MLKQHIPYSKKGEALVRLKKLKSYPPPKKITKPLPLKHQTIAGEQRLFGKAVYAHWAGKKLQGYIS